MSEYRITPNGRRVRASSSPAPRVDPIADDGVAIPVGMRKPKTLQEQIAEFMRSARIRQEFEQAGIETFEEADDFEVGDDYDPSTPYEMHFDSDLGREITNQEREFVEEGRRQFDAKVNEAKSKRREFVEEVVKPKKKAKVKAEPSVGDEVDED